MTFINGKHVLFWCIYIAVIFQNPNAVYVMGRYFTDVSLLYIPVV